MYKWLKINKKKHKFKDYRNLFNKIYTKNKYLELSNYIINKKYKLFFKNLKKKSKIMIFILN